jgi:hypothetical protein
VRSYCAAGRAEGCLAGCRGKRLAHGLGASQNHRAHNCAGGRRGSAMVRSHTHTCLWLAINEETSWRLCLLHPAPCLPLTTPALHGPGHPARCKPGQEINRGNQCPSLMHGMPSTPCHSQQHALAHSPTSQCHRACHVPGPLPAPTQAMCGPVRHCIHCQCPSAHQLSPQNTTRCPCPASACRPPSPPSLRATLCVTGPGWWWCRQWRCR